MIIQIDLKDPKYCDDCPALDDDEIRCNLGLYDINLEIEQIPDKISKIHFIRPWKCIEKYGE